jgi:hypothetical protein
MGILRNVYAWVASKLYASELDATCEHQDLGACDGCHALQVADRFA